MDLRKLVSSDIDKIVEMESDENTSKFIIPYSSEKHKVEISKKENLYLGIYEENILVGFFILGIEDSGKQIEFRRIVVNKKGRGIGQKAILMLDDYCSTSFNTEVIWLDVFNFNKRGIHIYEKLNYKKIKETTFENQKLLIMEKRIRV